MGVLFWASTNQSINADFFLFHALVFHPQNGDIMPMFYRNLRKLSICETMRENYPGRVQKGWNRSVQGLKSGHERSTEQICCQRTPSLLFPPRDRTPSHSGENFPSCVRNKEEGACGGGKTKVQTRALSEQKFVEAPLVQSLHNFWANQGCTVPFSPLS